VTAVAAAALGGCGDGDDATAVVPELDQIGPAIEALESELGGPQRYFEVNATGSTINLFVASDDATRVTGHSYLAGELLPPDEPREASGATFEASAIDFDPDTVLDRVLDELDDPVITRFVIVGGPGGAVQYAASVVSEQGGVLDVLLGADGTIQSVDPG
jgi:hypothetical protein